MKKKLYIKRDNASKKYGLKVMKESSDELEMDLESVESQKRHSGLCRGRNGIELNFEVRPVL